MKDKRGTHATLKNIRFRQICQSIHQYKVYKDTLFNWQIQFLCYVFFSLVHIIYVSVTQLCYKFCLSLVPLTLLTHIHCSCILYIYMCFFRSFYLASFHRFSNIFQIHICIDTSKRMKEQKKNTPKRDAMHTNQTVLSLRMVFVI